MSICHASVTTSFLSSDWYQSSHTYSILVARTTGFLVFHRTGLATTSKWPASGASSIEAHCWHGPLQVQFRDKRLAAEVQQPRHTTATKSQSNHLPKQYAEIWVNHVFMTSKCESDVQHRVCEQYDPSIFQDPSHYLVPVLHRQQRPARCQNDLYLSGHHRWSTRAKRQLFQSKALAAHWKIQTGWLFEESNESFDEHWWAATLYKKHLQRLGHPIAPYFVELLLLAPRQAAEAKCWTKVAGIKEDEYKWDTSTNMIMKWQYKMGWK